MSKQLVDIKLIKPNPDNPRTIRDDNFKKLVKSVQEFPKMLEKRPIVVDEDMMVLGGNMRLRACVEAGLKQVWIDDCEDWTEDEKRQFIIKDNVSGGDWDWDALANEWNATQLSDWGVDFPADWKTPEEIDEDEVPGPSIEPPVSELGKIYQLGRHRVMCGDSTDKANVELLMNGEKADMVFTDPPYGMDLDTDYSTITSGEGKSKKHSKVIGDDEPYDPRPLFDMFGYCEEIMLFGADYYLPRIPDWDKGNWLIWDKRETENYDKVIGSSFEVLWSKKKRRKEILRYEFVSWGKRMEDGEKTHPTMKPVKLLGRILDMTDSKAIVDLFLGSGSTLIACEQTDRICYGMELDPKYVDVIRKRYVKLANNGDLPENWQEYSPELSGK